MKKSIAFLVLLLSFSAYSQQKSISISSEDIVINKLTDGIKIVEEKTVTIPIYKDTLVETAEYKEIIQSMNRYKLNYDQWLNVKKTNEEYNADIAKIINNLETYIKSKEDYEITKPLIYEAQNLITKNNISYYGGSTMLSPNGKKPQKTKSFLDDPNYKTPVEKYIAVCKSIEKRNEPWKSYDVNNYLKLEEKLSAIQQFETIRVPSDKAINKKCLVLNDSVIVKESDLIGTFSVSDSKYAVLPQSENYANNEVVAVALLNQNIDNQNKLGSEILTNVVTGKKYLSENPNLLSDIESQKKLLLEKQQMRKELSKYGTVYYDKERESDMLKIQTGIMKLSSYDPQEIPEFVSIYNSLYTKLANNIKQMPAHITVLKKYYMIHRIQGRNMSQTNINAWINAVKLATPLRKSMQETVMNDHYGDYGFFPNTKYVGTHEDFDLYYNASLSILGI